MGGGCVPVDGPPYAPLMAALRQLLLASAPAIRMLGTEQAATRSQLFDALGACLAGLCHVTCRPRGRGRALGTASVIKAAPQLVGVDGIALDVHGDVYVVGGVQNLLTRVSPDGTVETLATAEDGLNQPSTIAFGTTRGEQDTLYLLGFSVFSPQPTPAILAVQVGVNGAPVP